MKTFIKMLRDDSGASAAEYALILAIIGAGIAIAACYSRRCDFGDAMNTASRLASTAADSSTALLT